jgi:hypothetical protein
MCKAFGGEWIYRSLFVMFHVLSIECTVETKK